MQRFLFLLPGLMFLALPAVRAESPFLERRSDPDSLSRLLASSERPTTFGLRMVTFLGDDDSLALIDVDDQTRDGDSDLKLRLVDEGDESPGTAAAGQQNPGGDEDRDSTTGDRVVEAVKSASLDDAGDDRRPETPPPSDDARLAKRMAELNKPATLLTVALPPGTAGDTPVNQAAEVFDQTPYWIVGGPSEPPPAQRVHIVFYHNPTYYQELNLERCGQLDCERCGYLQNLYSSIWFVGNTSLLPFRLAAQPPCECVPGYGDCLTCHEYSCPVEPLPLGDGCAVTGRGAISQSAALAGFVLLLW